MTVRDIIDNMVDIGMYEVLDRTHVIFDTFDRSVLNHQSVIENETIKAQAEKVEAELSDLYQLVAREIAENHNESDLSIPM